MEPMRDQSYLVSRQYADASNLNARIALHQRFSENKYDFVRWNFDAIDIPQVADVLELGAGARALWMKNSERIPPGWKITVSDLSSGMIEEARTALSTLDREFAFRQIDAQDIPFPAASFDAVLAMHMLFHVPDLARAIAEISRTLRPGGVLVASTNGRGNLSEMFDLVAEFSPGTPRPPEQNFALEDSPAKLSPWFSDVRIQKYPDALVVTEAAPLAGYVFSASRFMSIYPALRDDFTAFIQRRIDRDGSIRIAKNSGVVVAVKSGF
jgi:ubiquinone/menaquinone biosynthesis C-methylase UbiE